MFYKLNVPITYEKLSEMMNIIVQRQNALRTLFFEKTVSGKKKLYGRVVENARIEVEKYDISNFYKFRRPFDESKDLLIRVGLMDNTILMIDMNHNIADGYSFSILFNELHKLYNNEPLDELPIQINDYYNYMINNDAMNKKALDYYRLMFSEKFDTINITKKPIEQQTRYSSDTIDVEKIHNLNKYEILIVNTDSEIYNTVDKIIKKNNLSKSAYFFAVYCFIMAVYSGQNNIYAHILIANRMNDDIRNLIGLFIHLIPVLVKIENMTFIDYIKKVTDIVMTLMNFHIPYETLTDELNIPCYTSVFKFDPYELMTNDEISKFADLINEDEIYRLYGREDLISTNIKPRAENRFYHDFLMEVTEGKDFYSLHLLYKSSVFDKKLMEEMMNSFISLIKNENYLYENVDKLLKDSHKFLDKIEPITQFLALELNNDFEIMEYEEELKLKSSNISSVSTNEQEKNNNESLIEKSVQLEENQSNKKIEYKKDKKNPKEKNKKNKVKSIISKVFKSIKKNFKIKENNNKNSTKK